MDKTLLILAVFALSSCGNYESQPTLRIASDATFAPFHWLDKSGRPTGFDIELARAVANHAGFEPTVVVLPYAGLFSGLLDGTHDVVAATTGITAERALTYRFSDPYFTTCQVAVVRAGPTEPVEIADLRGMRIGAAGDGTSAQAMQTIDAIHIRLEDGQGVSSLLAGTIDAWIVDEFDGVIAARESEQQLKVLATGIANEQYALVLGKNRLDLQAKLNVSLQALEDDGTLAALRIEFGVGRGADWPVACQTNY